MSEIDVDIRAASTGDRAAFARLVDSHRSVICAITLAIVRDTSSSEDVAQDVFIAAWNDIGKLRNPSSFSPWLRQIARNRAHEHLRSRTRYARRHASWVEPDVNAVVDPMVDPRRRILADEEAHALQAALDQLPDDVREIVTLYYREGRSSRQVAELLGISEPAVKKRLERARTSLRSDVMERLGEKLQQTAPTAAFTAAIVAAISIGTPATATAASLGISKSAGAGKLLVLVSGLALGAGAALGAIMFGTRKLVRLARDDEERRAIERFGRRCVGLVAITVTAWIVGPWLWPGPLPMVVPWLWFTFGLGYAYLVSLPRITSRRLAAERAEDPEAPHRQRRDRIRSIVGVAVGVSSGLAGLLYGLQSAT
jgi:RNA polymerase sigma factor (sigma-70 family)